MNSDQDNIICEWLRSLGLQQYAAAFYDNGYDELEVCKLIQDEDLDAIGVTNVLHRKIILDSVLILKCEGATSVYFTLEEVNRARATANFKQQQHLPNCVPSENPPTRELIYDVSPRPNPQAFHQQPPNPSLGQGAYSATGPTLPLPIERLVRSKLEGEQVALGPNQQSFHQQPPNPSFGQGAYSTTGITLPLPIERLIRSKLEREQVDLGSAPYILQSGETSAPMVTALALRYAEELSQNYFQVLSVLEGIALASYHMRLPPQPVQQVELRNGHTTESQKDLSEMSLGNRHPPAIPTSPPPLNTHQISRESLSNPNFKSSSTSLHYHRSQSATSFPLPLRMLNQQGMVTGWAGTMNSNLEHTCGRTKSFQDTPCMVQRLPGCTCYPPQMPHNMAVLEQRRREAIVQAKAGKLSANQAMQQIKQCEKERIDMTDKKAKKKSTTTKIGEFLKLPSFRKKNKPADKKGGPKSDRSMSCSDACAPGTSYPMASSLSTSQLANEFQAKCTCCVPPAMQASRSMTFNAACSCDECIKMRPAVMQVPPPPSPMLSHRSTPIRGSARYPSNRRINADIVRAPPTCRQCNAPLTQPQKVLPKFYSPQVTRKTYQPLISPTPHHYNKPVVDKFEAWYQQNLPSDDETRHLIDPNQSDDNSINNTSFDAFVQSSRTTLVSPPTTAATRTAFTLVKDAAGLNNPAHSYHSDSLSSDDLSTRQQQVKLQSGSEASPTVTRGRRDSGCYLSNENLNNNSSNSSTCEKTTEGSSESNAKSAEPSKAAQSGGSKLLEKVRKQMSIEGIDLTRNPYTDEKGHWCVPISLVSRYAKLCGTDLTTVALTMDTARCNDLRSREQQCVPLSADTKGNPEQKRVSSVKEFLVLSGLPMYTESLIASGCDTLPSLAAMTEDKLRLCGITDPLHLEIILSAINSTWRNDSQEQLNDSQVHV